MQRRGFSGIDPRNHQSATKSKQSSDISTLLKGGKFSFSKRALASFLSKLRERKSATLFSLVPIFDTIGLKLWDFRFKMLYG